MKIKLLKYFSLVSLALIMIVLQSCKDDDVVTDGNTSHDRSVGTSSNDLLSSDQYTHLVIEIQYARNFKPPQAAIDNLRDFLAERLHKPGGITIITGEIAAPGQTKYSVGDIKAIEDAHRTQFTEGNTQATYFFFADGGYSTDTEQSKVLGIAYRNTSMALFQKTIKDHSGGLGQPSTALLTSSVMNHEFGHILGLVNNGTPLTSQHQDTAHGSHCNVEECLMYWTAETGQGISDLLGMSTPPPLDAQCIADLQANGGQ